MLIDPTQLPPPDVLEAVEHRLRAEWEKREAKRSFARPGGLIKFIRYFWDVLEPITPFVDGWALEAICEHLEAITDGHITRLLANVCPGFMKSLATDVFWPAWEWGPKGLSSNRFVTFSYSASLTERDNDRFRTLVMSQKYQALYGNDFKMVKTGETRVSNDKMGWKLASSVGGVGTGERGDRIILDDPHNVKEAESDIVRTETVRWFRESMSNRLNDMDRSAIVVIMQRVHEADVSGTILDEEMEYEHLMIPMLYDPGRHCSTSIGWEDPRDYDGELAWPARFSEAAIVRERKVWGPYAFEAQYQQAPAPRGGGIIKRDWWQPWAPKDGKYPVFDFLLASVDTAYTEKEENDPSAMTVWGVFKGQGGLPCAMLVKAWRKHLEMHGTVVERDEGESYRHWRRRAEPGWGLVEWVAETCRFRDSSGAIVGRVDKLLIEAKASGITVAQEIQRLYGDELWSTELADPKGDKVARAHAIVPIFANEQVFAGAELDGEQIFFKEWADLVITETSIFPKGRYRDLTDTVTQALKHLRSMGLLQHREEIAADEERRSRHRKPKAALYAV